MSLRLETSVGTPLVRATLALAVTVAVMVAMLALSPAAAEAQTSAPTEDRSARAVVVRPGDSLWSVSEERLGPNASPRSVMKGAERIHELNRARIGADPNLILVGQKLLLPPAMSGPPTGATVPARKAAAASGADPRDRAAKVPAGKEAPRKAAGQGTIPRSEISLEEAAETLGTDTKGGEAPETVAQQEAEPVGLPALQDEAAAAPVPAVRAVASDDSPASTVASFLRTLRAEAASAASALAGSFFAVAADARADGRRLLGVGIWALTLFVVALLAWKLPTRRTTREDAERWGMSSGYYGETTPASGTTPFFYHPGTLGVPLGDRDEQDARRAVFVGGGTASSPSVARETGAPAGRGRAPRARAKVRARAVPRNGLALGAHNPEVRRAPRRARAAMRARRLRPRLRPKGVSARGGR